MSRVGKSDSGRFGFGGFEKAQKGPYAYLLLDLIFNEFVKALLQDNILLAHKAQHAIYSLLYESMRRKVPPPWPVPGELMAPLYNKREDALIKSTVLREDLIKMFKWLEQVIDVLYENGIIIEYRYRGIRFGVEE